MKFLRFFLATLLLTMPVTMVTPVVALELNITKINGGIINQFRKASVGKAQGMLVGYTLLLKARRMPLSQARLIPFSGIAVAYFPNKREMIVWSGKSQKVERGVWQIVRSHSRNDVCFAFAKGKGAALCTRLGQTKDFIQESVRGNPFKLKANQPVPFRMGRFGVSLEKLAQKLD